MASSVTKHKSGNWCFYFYDSKKSPKSKWFYFSPDQYTKREVRQIRNRYANLYRKGEWTPWEEPINESDLTLLEAKDEYLKRIPRELSENTVKYTTEWITKFIDKYKKQKVGNLTSADISDYINAYENYNTRRTVNYVLTRFYDWLYQKGYRDKVQIEMLSTRQEKKQQTKYPITRDQLDLLIQGFRAEEKINLSKNHANPKRIEHAYKRHIDMTFVLFYMGLRMADVLHLRPAWILGDLLRIGDLKQWNLKDEYHPKSRKEHDQPIAIPKEVEPILTEWSADKGNYERMFGLVSPQYYRRPFKRASVHAFGKDFADKFTPHSLRHSCATYWLNERNVPVQEVQRLMRHEDIKTTMKYYHPSTESHISAFRK